MYLEGEECKNIILAYYHNHRYHFFPIQFFGFFRILIGIACIVCRLTIIHTTTPI